ncbi:MAG: NAD(P)/FAD-dependent oxidoreductase [Candidatus Taylorbacteria bacterium]|nr:NAD(P)/FAD-dependent oxidoreductase [Candidatus Taylorbacteria bacterium]
MIKILILGGGFGGIRAALDLDKKLKKEAEITLIDRNGYHLFVPALYEVASAYGIKKDPFAVQLRRTICMPYADIFSAKGGPASGGNRINFIQAEISEINLAHKMVKIGGDRIAEYDYLVVALGSEVADYNIPGVRDYAHQFKTLDDALFINQKLEELSEQFLKGERIEPFSFLICGGGFTGIELAAELGCCTKVIKEKCKLRGRCSSITLFEAGPRILPAISEKERRHIKERLTKLGIILMENSPIEEAGPDFIKLKTGQKLHGDLIIWTAGIQSNQLLCNTSGLPLTLSGKIATDDTLQVKNLKNIFAIGDNLEFTDLKSQKPVPAFAYVAVDQGKIVAQNIYNSIKNKKLKSYKPFSDVWIIPIGGKFALAHLWGGLLIKGFWGWVIRELVDIKYLLSIFSLNKALEVFFNEITIFSKND